MKRKNKTDGGAADWRSVVLDQLSLIHRHVEKAYPEGHKLRMLFNVALADDAPTAAIQKAWKAWLALPAAEQSRVLNGWAFDPTVPNVKEEIDALGASITPNLVLDGGEKPQAWQQWVVDGSIHRVRMLITMGVTQAEAMAAVETFRDAIANQWSTLISSDGFHELRASAPASEVGHPKLGEFGNRLVDAAVDAQRLADRLHEIREDAGTYDPFSSEKEQEEMSDQLEWIAIDLFVAAAKATRYTDYNHAIEREQRQARKGADRA